MISRTRRGKAIQHDVLVPAIKLFYQTHVGCSAKQCARHFDLKHDTVSRILRKLRGEWGEPRMYGPTPGKTSKRKFKTYHEQAVDIASEKTQTTN